MVRVISVRQRMCRNRCGGLLAHICPACRSLSDPPCTSDSARGNGSRSGARAPIRCGRSTRASTCWSRRPARRCGYGWTGWKGIWVIGRALAWDALRNRVLVAWAAKARGTPVDARSYGSRRAAKARGTPVDARSYGSQRVAKARGTRGPLFFRPRLSVGSHR
jgi:hypothetical protein